MIPFSSCHDYYKKMLELQEKLQKSEEERMRLVERFNLMEQKSRLKHETSINRLRMRYIEFLEEQKVRDERNHELLSDLDRVDENLALMSAKADRLCTLREEYDALLIPTYANWRQTGNIAVDSGVFSQNEDGKIRKDLPNSYVVPRPRSNTERIFDTHPTSPDITRNNKGNDIFLQYRQSQVVNHRQNNKLQLSPSENPVTAGEYLSNDFNLVLKRDARANMLTEEFSSSQHPECLDSASSIPRLRNVLDTLLSSKEERVGSVSENELDRYIHRIRSLHDNNNSHSLEEIEQNINGDLLNVTLSDDSLDHSLVGKRISKQEIPTEVSAILSIADDLVPRINEDIHVADYMNHVEPHHNTDEIPNVHTGEEKSLSESAVDSCVAVMEASVRNSDIQPVTLMPVCALVVEDEINNDVAIRTTELNMSTDDIKSITTPASIDNLQHSKSAHSQRDDFDFRDEHAIAENINNHVKIVDSNELLSKPREVRDHEKSGIVNDLKTRHTENLEIQKRSISANRTPDSADVLSHFETDVPSHSVDDNDFSQIGQNDESTRHAEVNITTEISVHANVISDIENDMDGRRIPSVDYDMPQRNYESTQEKQCEPLYTQNPQDYPQDPNQIYEYNNDQYDHDLNQQYQYDPNLQYEQSANGEYQYDQNLQFEDPNAQYQNQSYINASNQQYTVNPDEQYHEYRGETNQHYKSEAYIQNSNTSYDPAAVYTYPTDNQDYMVENNDDAPQDIIPDQHHSELQEQSDHYETHPDVDKKSTMNHQIEDDDFEEQHMLDSSKQNILLVNHHAAKEPVDVSENILDSNTESIIEKNISNTESDFDFN